MKGDPNKNQVEGKPLLLFFYAPTGGPDRRIEGFLAQVLQRRGNHETFVVKRIDVTQRPDLAERFRVTDTPTLMVVHGKKVAARLSRPKTSVEMTAFMTPWLGKGRPARRGGAAVDRL